MNGDGLIQVSVYLVDPTRRPGSKPGAGYKLERDHQYGWRRLGVETNDQASRFVMDWRHFLSDDYIFINIDFAD